MVKEETYLITGATGYIGNMLVKKILTFHRNSKVILPVRNRNKAESMYLTELRENPGKIEFLQGSLEESLIGKVNEKVDYIIHCAAPTKSAYMISNPVETMDAIVLGTKNILELAKHLKVESMVYLSSMEVYGNVPYNENGCITEEELGDIDLFRERSCYPLGKRTAEYQCYAYFKEYHVPVKIARLAQTFGRGVLPEENRVFAQFARAAKKGEDIVLHTEGKSVGNYCDIDDAMEAVFLLLHKGVNGEAYNVVNEENTMTIRKMAELVAGLSHGKSQIIMDIPDTNKYGYAADTGIRLSSDKLRKLGWKPEHDLTTMYLKLIDEIH